MSRLMIGMFENNYYWNIINKNVLAMQGTVWSIKFRVYPPTQRV